MTKNSWFFFFRNEVTNLVSVLSETVGEIRVVSRDIKEIGKEVNEIGTRLIELGNRLLASCERLEGCAVRLEQCVVAFLAAGMSPVHHLHQGCSNFFVSDPIS